MSTILKKLSDFQQWRRSPDGEGITLLDYVGFVATPDLFFAFDQLFHPDLLVHDGNYYLASHFEPEIYREWSERTNDVVEIQKVMNHVHISTVFQNQSMDDDVAIAIARKLEVHWSLVFRDNGLRGLAFGSAFDDAAVTLFNR